MARPCASAAVLAIAWIGFSQPSAAQTRAPKADCSKAGATPELNYCAELDLEKADKALNQAYRAALARIDQAMELDAKVRAEWRKTLQDAQRKWIAFRDADCKGAMAYEWYGGTGATAAVLGCMTGLTEARTKELRERNER
jgi:uncharacterized protein YecT (DUF1311 family)